MTKRTTGLCAALCAVLILTGCAGSTNGNAAQEETTETEHRPEGEGRGDRPDGTPPEKPDGGPGGGPGGAPGGSSADIDYKAAHEITSGTEEKNETYGSDTADESALLIAASEAVTIAGASVTKTGDSDGGDNCNFYGLNAAVLVKDGSETTITDAVITSDAEGANGVFCYGGNGGQNGASGDGTTVIIRDSEITTTGNGSGGIMTTGGGITYAYDLTVETSGRSSAPIRTDRGGGQVYAEGGSYTSNGLGSGGNHSHGCRACVQSFGGRMH